MTHLLWLDAPIINPSVAHHVSLCAENRTQLRHVTNQVKQSAFTPEQGTKRRTSQLMTLDALWTHIFTSGRRVAATAFLAVLLTEPG
jgi:hypothetical protein